jgi:hypothetical protein
MKTPLLPFAATALALLAVGCTSIDPSTATAARIQEKSDTFARLTPAAQKVVQAGGIEKGFTPDLVYMALGQPAKVRAKDSSLGKLEMWIYVIYTPQSVEAQNNINHPDSAKYVPMVNSVNTPSHGGPAYAQPGGFGFGEGTAMQPLSVPDLKAEKLYVFFANGQVTEIKFDSTGT